MNSNYNKKSAFWQILKSITLIVILSLQLPYTLYAQTAEFQLLVPTPDPILAGEKLTIQIIVANTGADTWDTGNYSFEVEIYDSQKQYVGKSSRLKGTESVSPGNTTLVFTTYNIPQSYSGTYYFKAGLTFHNQRIAYSDFISFTVTPLTALPRPSTRVGGNSIISYKNETKDNVSSYVGNVSLNLLGNIGDNSFVSNIYTYHTPEKQVDLYNIVFNYYTPNMDLSLGDVMPSFTSLSLSNIGLRGIQPLIRAGIFETTILGSRSIEPKEATDSGYGTYGRYIYGICEKISISDRISTSLSYVLSQDDEKSINNPVPAQSVITNDRLKAIKNEVIGFNIKSEITDGLTISGDFASGSYFGDYRANTGADYGVNTSTTDSAYRIGLESRFGRFSGRLNYQLIGTNFYSLGSPTTLKDRASNEVFLSYGIPKIGSFSGSYMNYIDNLKNDPAKITTTQNIMSINSILPLAKTYNLSIGYSANELTSNPITMVNNKTNSVTLMNLFSLGKISMILGGLSSNFRNVISSGTDSDTISANLGINFAFTAVSFNFGVSRTQITNIKNATNNIINAISLTSNFSIIPEKFVVSILGNINDRKDNNISLPSEQITTIGNIELTYYFNPKFAFTIGAGQNNLADNINSANSYSTMQANTRINLGF